MNRQIGIGLMVALGLAAGAAAQGLATQKVLTLEGAKKIAAAAENHATAQGWRVNIAIVDDAGDLLYFERRLGVQTGSIDVAILKAASAARFKRATKVFSDLIAGQPGLAMVPGAIAVEGGLPIFWEGELLGAIGISGVTSAQDGMIAKAAVDAVEGILK